MSNWWKLFTLMDDECTSWFLDIGKTNSVPAGTVIVEEGSFIDSLYFVNRGLFWVETSLMSGRPLAKLGPGDMIGELSFIDQNQTSASVIAEEESEVLTIPRQVLEEKLSTDDRFAARFYKVLGHVTAQRLRRTIGQFGNLAQANLPPDEDELPTWRRVETKMHRFKQMISEADKTARISDDVVPDELAAEIEREFGSLSQNFSRLMEIDLKSRGVFANELGFRVRNELLPYIFLTKTAERVYAKPRGYPGDFLTIDLIYKNQPKGAGRVGGLIDRCFLSLPVAQAIRNRRKMFAKEILDSVSQSHGRPARVTSLTCGPGREVFDVYDRMEDKSELVTTMLDIDFSALSFVADERNRRRLEKNMSLLNENLVYVALGRKGLDLPPQDLIYSIGLMDNFEDPLVVKLINAIHGMLKPGGRLILGSFHQKNPDKALMDWVMDWKLIHRDEKQIDQLFERSGFARPCSKVQFEEQGICLLAECVKE